MKLNTEQAAKKPRLALLLATGFGLGYLPKAPGTWGSLGGVGLLWLVQELTLHEWHPAARARVEVLPPPRVAAFASQVIVAFVLALIGIWAAGRAAKHIGAKDPQIVVIDEVSGQHLALLAGLGWNAALNWKYLLLGFILFRVFDIWKPFPVRQAERLPGGWGIMADDWVAAIYAALSLWLARLLGL